MKGLLCMKCFKTCEAGSQADIWPPILYSDCCAAQCGLDADGAREAYHLRCLLEGEVECLSRRTGTLSAEIDRRGILIEEQERELGRLREELGRR